MLARSYSNVTLGAAIIAVGPLLIEFVLLFFVAVLGLVWSPFAALITRRLALRRGLDGGRYALAGAAYSVFLMFPWLLLVITMIRVRLPRSVVLWSYVLLYLVWLVGPIIFWGQFVAHIGYVMTFGLGGGLSENLKPDDPLVAYGVFAVMILMWVVSGTISWRVSSSVHDVTVDELMSLRYIMPFALVWVCTLFAYGYLFLANPSAE